jgi:uncharacterized protein (TIGR03437 family)
LAAGTGVVNAQSASPLTVAVTGGFPIQLSCQQGVAWTAPTPINVTVTAAASTFFFLDTTTYNPPVWLSVGAISGLATPSGVSVGLSAEQYCLTMLPGVYTATIAFDVLPNGSTTYLPKTVAVRFTVDTSPPALSATVTGGTPASMYPTCVFTPSATAPSVVCNWSSGIAPTLTVSLSSSGAPVSFAVACALVAETSGGVSGSSAFYGVANPATVSPTSSIGYSWGTPLTVTFSTQAFLQTLPGDAVQEAVTVTPAAGAAITLSITINVTAPVPLLTSTSPALVPVDSTQGDTITVVLNGSGFVPSTVGNSQSTMVYYCNASDPTTCLMNEVNITVVSTTELVVSYQVISGGYTSAAGSWYIGVCNPMGVASCSVSAGSVATVTVTTSPIITAVTSASTFQQGATAFAPYDIVSIFGSNFCPGCLALANPTLTLSPTAANDYRFPTSASPDNTNFLTVGFYNNAGTPSEIASGYLLFANNTQINVLVPSAVANSLGAGNIQVGYGAPPAYSTFYPVTYAATDPGLFTVNSAGTGQGAILNYDWTANSVANPVIIGGKATSTQVVHIYLTGLGVPNSTGSINTAGASTLASPGSCVAISGANGFLAAANTVYGLSGNATWTSLDGVVINNAVLNGVKANHLPPCLTPEPTVTIGGVAATVTYAGWVTGSVAGLYQIDAQVSSKVTLTSPPNALPVLVTIGTKPAVTSQAGVTVVVTN